MELLKRGGCAIPPPPIPHLELMPLSKLCQRALSLAKAGFEKQAGELAYWLLPFERFLPLWCSEKEYREKEVKEWYARLAAEIVPIPSDDPWKGEWKLVETDAMSAVFTLSSPVLSPGTSLGMIRAGDVEIRAFGPQVSALRFGIRGKGMDGWTRIFAWPEAWLEMKGDCREGECFLALRFIGLTPTTPLQLAFYVKAESCEIEKEILKPKSLRRFQGEGKSVTLQGVKLESRAMHKIEVIPLAGEGCFWDCDFLVAFEIHPLAPQANFLITSVAK